MMVIQATHLGAAAVTPAAWIELLGVGCSCLLEMRHGSPPGTAFVGSAQGFSDWSCC